MKRLKIILLLMACIPAFTISAQKPDNYDKELQMLYNNSVELITANELADELESGKQIVLLDSREKNEFKTSHIRNARYVGYNTFNIKSLQDIPKDTPIVVYCSLGVRSEKVGEQLKQAGYSNVKNLYGGIFEWVYFDQPVYDKKGNSTQNVHAYDQEWSKWLLKGNKIY